MKKLIALALVIGLAGLGFAQDLDAPTMGTAIEQSPDAPSAANSNAYDIIVAKILEKEAKYLARQIQEAEWMIWGRDYWGWSPQTFEQWAEYGTQSWQSEAGTANDLWNALSPAENAAAKNEMAASHERVLAAGLN